MKSVEVLKKARELLAGGWCQYAFAQDKDGDIVPWMSTDAVCFCIDGALMRAGDAILSSRYWPMLFCAIRTDDPMTWNDAEDRTQDEVLAAFDHAIAHWSAQDAAAA